MQNSSHITTEGQIVSGDFAALVDWVGTAHFFARDNLIARRIDGDYGRWSRVRSLRPG